MDSLVCISFLFQEFSLSRPHYWNKITVSTLMDIQGKPFWGKRYLFLCKLLHLPSILIFLEYFKMRDFSLLLFPEVYVQRGNSKEEDIIIFHWNGDDRSTVSMNSQSQIKLIFFNEEVVRACLFISSQLYKFLIIKYPIYFFSF